MLPAYKRAIEDAIMWHSRFWGTMTALNTPGPAWLGGARHRQLQSSDRKSACTGRPAGFGRLNERDMIVEKQTKAWSLFGELSAWFPCRSRQGNLRWAAVEQTWFATWKLQLNVFLRGDGKLEGRPYVSKAVSRAHNMIYSNGPPVAHK